MGVTLLQFVCALTMQELEIVRREQVEVPTGRLKGIIDEIDDTIPRARSKNFPKMADSLIEHLSPSFPAAYRAFIGRFLEFRFEDRMEPSDIAKEFRKVKADAASEVSAAPSEVGREKEKGAAAAATTTTTATKAEDKAVKKSFSEVGKGKQVEEIKDVKASKKGEEPKGSKYVPTTEESKASRKTPAENVRPSKLAGKEDERKVEEVKPRKAGA